MTIGKLQFVWWPSWQGIGWHRFGLSRVYRGSFRLGWLGIRVWR